MMPWQGRVALLVLLTYIIRPYFTKKIAGLPGRTRRLIVQYLCCAGIAGIAAAVFPAELRFGGAFFALLAVGFVNAIACYCHWRAIDLSLSRTSVFTHLDDLIAMALGYLVLGEVAVLGPMLSLGILLCLGSVIWYFVEERRGAAREGTTPTTPALLKWVLAYSVMWGGAVFFERYFALGRMSVPTFLLGWYGGALLGSLAVYPFAGKVESGQPLPLRSLLEMAYISALTLVSTGMGFWSYQKAPLAVVQPIVEVAEMVFPTIIGLWIFKEVKHLSRRKALIFAVGILGGLVIGLSY